MSAKLSNAELVTRLAAVECPAFRHRRNARPGAHYGPPPIVLARGQGSFLFDVEGKRYLDLTAGFGSVLLGHGHPALAAAVREQADRLVQGLGDVYASDTKLALLEQLVALFPADGAQALLCQSGADAVTAALKTALLFTGRPGVLAFDGAYHGLGFAPLPACGFAPSFREPFAAQLNPHVRFAAYPGVRGASLDQSLEQARALLLGGDVGAVLLEPIAGRGGCVVPPAGFVAALGALAAEHGALLIADEIWTGLGRSGAMLSSVEQGGAPDIVCLGKGLGGGLPISACVARAEVMDAWARGGEVVHTSTHAGAPLGCAAALAVLGELKAADLPARAQRLGAAFQQQCREQLADCDVREVRGAGLMVGIELASAERAQRLLARLQTIGFVAVSGGVDGATLTLTPALTMAEDELSAVAEALCECLS